MRVTYPVSTPRAAWAIRVRAAAIHLCLSLLVAALAGALVFGVWYPYPYSEISGGRELFLLLVAVDVVIGPLITLVVFAPGKVWRVMRRDLLVVAALQLVAMGYGVWTMAVARPVHLVFEYSRFQVVHAVEVPPALLPKAPEELRALPLRGPTALSLRPFRDSGERMEATMAAFGGVALGARPDLWQAYAAGQADVLQVARPLSELRARFASRAPQIDAAIAGTGRRAAALGYVPMIGRKAFWTVIVDSSTAEVLGFIPLDSF